MVVIPLAAPSSEGNGAQVGGNRAPTPRRPVHFMRALALEAVMNART